MITIPDTVISPVNTLCGNQTNLLILKDTHGRLVGYIETPGVGADSDEGEVEFLGVNTELEEV